MINLIKLYEKDKKKTHQMMCYNHTPYISANRHRMKPTIQNNLTISASRQPNLSK